MESVSVSENVLCTMQIKHGVIQNVRGFMKSQSDNTHTARYTEGIKKSRLYPSLHSVSGVPKCEI